MPRMVVPVALLAALASACETRPCTLDARMGLQVRVESAGPEDMLVVVAVSADHSEQLHCALSEPGQECVGLQERPGDFVVTVTLNGVNEEQAVTLEHDGCHVVMQTLTFFEVPGGAG